MEKLPVPSKLSRWFENQHSGELGSIKYSHEGGFFENIFANREDSNNYFLNLVSPGAEVSYRSVYAYPHGFLLTSHGEDVALFDTKGEFSYCDSDEGGAFLLFMNLLFGNGHIPSLEVFQAADIGVALDIAEEPREKNFLIHYSKIVENRPHVYVVGFLLT